MVDHYTAARRTREVHDLDQSITRIPNSIPAPLTDSLPLARKRDRPERVRVSAATTPRDPERMINMGEKLVRVGALTPEGRCVPASDVFNREFAKLGADWTKRSLTITLAGIQSGIE